jgi:hypothetical protein
MNRAEYDLLRKRIEDTCRRDLEALERVWALAQDIELPQPEPPAARLPAALEPSPAAEKSPEKPQFPGPIRADVVKEVRAAIPKLQSPFSVHDVEQLILTQNPDLKETLKRSSITSALNRLVEGHEVALVRTGAGKRPSFFATPGTFGDGVRKDPEGEGGDTPDENE